MLLLILPRPLVPYPTTFIMISGNPGNPRIPKMAQHETRGTNAAAAVHRAAAAMRYHAPLFATITLVATPSGSAFQASVGLTASRRNTASSSSRLSMSWRGLLDGVMGRTDSSSSSSSGVLTPKSRVKLGDLSVSPMGERWCFGTWQRGTAIALNDA